MKQKKQLLLICLLSVLLANCGGGGGGGGGGSNLPNKPSIPQNISETLGRGKKDYNDLVKAHGEVKAREIIEKNRKSVTASIPQDNKVVTGSTQKIGILDSDFITHKIDLEGKYPGIKILDRIPAGSPPNNKKHGEQVLEVMAKNINLQVIAASIGEPPGEGIKAHVKLYEDIFHEMGNQKVKVFNQSWGTNVTMKDSSFITDPAAEGNVIAALGSGHGTNSYQEGRKMLDFYKKAVEAGGIFVWANGNRGPEPSKEALFDASLEGGLPYFHKYLEPGWITVVGVEPKRNGLYNIHYDKDEHGNDARLAYPGNDAKQWAISASAKGYVQSDNTYGVGSSFAAPRVSKAAALVAEKFPWMTNDQVRHTLFTTTDETEASKQHQRRRSKIPDDKYGWGMLNEDRALKGPGMFINISSDVKHSDMFEANVPLGTTSYFENEILGTGGIEKSGKGTLHLTKNNSFSGEIVVEEGTLELHGVQAAGEVFVEAAGKLVLNPKVLIGYSISSNEIIKEENIQADKIEETDLNNSGIVQVKGTTAIVGGDFRAKKGSTTEIGSDAKLTVLGDIIIDEGNVKILADKYISTKENRTLLEGRTSAGKIGSIEIDGMRVASANLKDGKLEAELSRQNATSYLGEAEESSQKAAEKVEKVFTDLDEKVKAGTASSEELIMGAAIQTMSRTTFARTTEKLSGEIYASAQALTLSQAQNINRDLSNRLAGIENLSNSKKDWNAWGSAIGSDGKLRRSGYASADTHVVGGQFGADKKVNDRTTLGLALSYSYAHADFNKYAGTAKSDMIGVSLYGKEKFQENWYVAGRLGVANVSSRVKRELVDKIGNTVQGDIKHKDNMFSAYVEIGKKYHWLTPFIGYSQDYLRRGSFSESNAAWGIHSDAKSYWNSNVLVGLRAEYDFQKYRFQSYVTHAFNVHGRDLKFEGHFTGNTTKQVYEGVKQAKNTTWIGVGLFREMTSNFGVYGNVDFRMENGRAADTVFSTGVQFKF